jgi:hypothetical protein
VAVAVERDLSGAGGAGAIGRVEFGIVARPSWSVLKPVMFGEPPR